MKNQIGYVQYAVFHGSCPDNILFQIRIDPGAEDLIHTVAHHFNSGADNHQGYQNTEVMLNIDPRDLIDRTGYQHGYRNQRIAHTVSTGHDHCRRADLCSLFLHDKAVDKLGKQGHAHDRHQNCGIFRRLMRMKNRVNRIRDRCDADIQNDHCDQQGAHILQSPIAERMTWIRAFRTDFYGKYRKDLRDEI